MLISIFKSHFYTIPIPPLLPITGAFAIGILTPIPHYVLIAAGCVTFFYFFAKNKNIRLQCMIFAMMGACSYGTYLIKKHHDSHEEIQTFIHKKPLIVCGTIINKNQYEKKWTVLEIAIDYIECNAELKKCNKSALLYCEQNDMNLCVGDTVTFHNLTSKKSKNDDFNRYLIKEQVAFISFNKDLYYTNLVRPSWSLRRFVHTQKTRLLTSLYNKLSPETFRFFSSLFLGNRMCIKNSLEKTNEQFKTWGISHFLARSGLHLTLFLFIWRTIMSYVPCPFIIKQLFFIILSFIYFILTWTSSPFSRAFCSFLIHKFFLLLKLPSNFLHILTLVFLLFLLYCPLYLFFLDFQLSFALTFALAWINQLVIAKNKSKIEY